MHGDDLDTVLVYTESDLLRGLASVVLEDAGFCVRQIFSTNQALKSGPDGVVALCIDEALLLADQRCWMHFFEDHVEMGLVILDLGGTGNLLEHPALGARATFAENQRGEQLVAAVRAAAAAEPRFLTDRHLPSVTTRV
jgi:hypothetical protein